MNQQEWRNQAGLANYPFVSNASRTNVSDSGELQTLDIVDAHLIARTAEETGFHLSELTVGGTVSGTISSSSGTFGTFSVTLAQIYGAAVKITDAAGVDRGVIIFGKNESELFGSLPFGLNEFDSTALAFHPGVVFHPPVKRVATLSINDTELYGRVRLKAGTGIRLELLNEGGKDIVVVHAVGAQADLDCGSGKPIKNFNSVPPNQYGTIFLRPSPYMTPETFEALRQVLRVRANDAGNGIVVSIAELNA